MSANVVLEERNGADPGIPSLSPVTLNMGSSDESDLTPSAAPITAQSDGHAYEKYVRILVSDLGGSTVIDNTKVWLSSIGSGWATGEGMSTNLTTTGYSAVSYDDPVDTDSSVAVNVMLEAEPAGSNLGIGGSLAGQIIAAPNYSDYIVLQLDVSELTPAGSVQQKTITFQYDEQ